MEIPEQCISMRTSNRLITPIHSMAIFQLIKVLVECELEIEPEQFLVLFQPGTTSVQSGLGTFFVPELEHAKHFLCS